MIYICVPTYNEARTVGVLLWKIRQVMAEFPRDYQVLVADDGSTDATPEVLAPYTRVLPLTVYRHEERHGYAASIEKLLREVVRRSDYPRRDILITLQADFTEEPEEIPTLVRRIEGGADVVTGALTLRDAHAPRSVRWTHKLLGYLVRRGRWPEGISDPLSGFRAYRVITIRRVLDERNGRPLFQGEGWAANVELLRAVVPFARRVDEAPVAIRYDRRFRETRFRPWETVRGILSLLRSRPAPEEGAAEVATAGPEDGAGWEEMKVGSALADAARARRNGERRRPARRRGGERSRGAEGAGDATGARGRARGARGEGGEAGAAEAAGTDERAARGGRGAGRRRRVGAGAAEEGEQSATNRRRRGGRPRRRQGEAAEAGPAGAAAAEGVAGEGGNAGTGGRTSTARSEARSADTGSADSSAPTGARRRRRGGTRPRAAASGTEQESPASAAQAETGGGEGEAERSGAGGGARRGRRGGRRGGRRTGSRPAGTPGEDTSPGPAATE